MLLHALCPFSVCKATGNLPNAFGSHFHWPHWLVSVTHRLWNIRSASRGLWWSSSAVARLVFGRSEIRGGDATALGDFTSPGRCKVYHLQMFVPQSAASLCYDHHLFITGNDMENGRKRRLCRPGTKFQERESWIVYVKL